MKGNENMSYTKTLWEDGNIITSEKLNKMEQGIYDASSDGIFYIEIEIGYDSVNGVETRTLTSNVTGQQILDAINNGMIVAEKITGGERDGFVAMGISYFTWYAEEQGYIFNFIGNMSTTLYASSLSENLTILSDDHQSSEYN